MIDVISEQGKFIAAKTCHQIILAYTLGKLRGNLDKQTITRRVPVSIVDIFEAIQVEKQQCTASACRGDALNFLFQLFDKIFAVNQAGTR
jgi:hypothetical protein